MATLKLAILKNKPALDGSYKIRVAVCHKKKTTYIMTRFKIETASQFKNGMIVKHPQASSYNTKLRNLLNQYQERLDEVKNISLYDSRQLRDVLATSTINHSGTFHAVADEYIASLIEDGRENYAKLIERNARYFKEYTKTDIMLADITPTIIENYSRFLKKKGLNETTVGMFMSRTRTIINRAKKVGLVKYDIEPFSFYKIRQASVREVDLTLDNFNKIKNSLVKEKKFVVAKDLFLLSFYLGGINMVDLLNLDFRHDQISYERTKSINTVQGERKIVLTVPEPVKAIVKKWRMSNGRLNFGYHFTYANFYRYITRSLNTLADREGVNQKVVFYSARKTFAQFASDLGIPDGVINYCLGHSDKSKGVIRYYTKVRQKQAEIAINRVIEYTEHPELYKEFIEMRSDIMMLKV